MVSLWKTILTIVVVDCINYDRYYVSGDWNQSCVTNVGSCSVCCVGQKCHKDHGFPNACEYGCIDGHRGARCYELCMYDCKQCSLNIDKCESCLDGFYLDNKKDCKSKCLPNCKECSSGDSCVSCKDGFYNKDGSNDCRYPVCPTNCVCNNGECVKCNEGFFDTSKLCTSKCPYNCAECSSASQCSLCTNGFYNDSTQGIPCSIPCRDTCTICSTYDECLQCQQGRFGKQCQNNCSSGCRNNVCEIETGKCDCSNNFSGERCTECVPGKFSTGCDKNCPDNCNNGICGKNRGDCSEGCISETITGTYCDKCITGKYGKLCDDNCPEKCSNNICNNDNGTCSEGCKERFDGPFCSECIQGKYGQKCEHDCPGTCKNNECDRGTGHCFNCTGQFEGYKCDICKQGFYGSECDQKCSPKCLNVSCGKDTGNCIHGCITTYSGDKCCIRGMECVLCANSTTCRECSTGYFGETCNETCSNLCLEKVCEITSGICTNGCTASSDKNICLQNQGTDDTTDSSSSLGVIAAGVLGGIAFIALGILAIFCFVKLRRMRKPSDRTSNKPSGSNTDGHVYENFKETHLIEKPEELENADNTRRVSEDIEKVRVRGRKSEEVATFVESDQASDEESEDDTGASDKHRVKVTNLYSYVTKKHPDAFANEFVDLAADDLDLSKHCTDAMMAKNLALNRYNGIYPYDHSRVKLAGLPNFFINACFIDGYNKKKAFIASLGPTLKTTDKFSNFWLMVWHERSDIIVMLTNLREASGMKCEQYWPDSEVGQQFHQITVKCRSIEEFAEYTVRTFTITKGKEERNVIQLHYTAWPDKGVPQEVTSLVEFRQRVKIVRTVLGGPVIVHCSAGVGRTGTYIALDIQTKEGKDKGSVDVFNCVNQMRKQRVNMVQTGEQYKFLYKALVHSLTFECETLTAEDIQAFMYEADDQKFKDMYQILQREIDTECKEDVEAREENRRRHKDRNRRHSDIPANRSRVRLFVSRVDSSNDYINAVFINSFKTKNLFIAAQSPLTKTVEDFLCMIYQQNCACVVALDQAFNQNKIDGKYLPADNETFMCGHFTVTSSKCTTQQHYIVKKLTIQHSTQSEVKTMYHFQYKKWAESNKVPDSIEDFVHFIKAVEKRLNQTTDSSQRVVVHCLTGYGKTGLFCTLFRLLEKLEAERQVSVVNAIRNVRTHRRLAITGEEQLKFCFQCISAYLEMYNTYTNFAT